MLAKYIVTALLQQNRCERFFEVFLLSILKLTYIHFYTVQSLGGLVVNPQQCGDQLAFDNEYKIGRSTTGILCFSQISAGSPYAPKTDATGSGETVENIVLPVTWFSMTGLVVGRNHQDTICHLISLSYKHVRVRQTTGYYLCCCNEISAKWSSLPHQNFILN